MKKERKKTDLWTSPRSACGSRRFRLGLCWYIQDPSCTLIACSVARGNVFYLLFLFFFCENESLLPSTRQDFGTLLCLFMVWKWAARLLRSVQVLSQLTERTLLKLWDDATKKYDQIITSFVVVSFERAYNASRKALNHLFFSSFLLVDGVKIFMLKQACLSGWPHLQRCHQNSRCLAVWRILLLFSESIPFFCRMRNKKYCRSVKC